MREREPGSMAMSGRLLPDRHEFPASAPRRNYSTDRVLLGVPREHSAITTTKMRLLNHPVRTCSMPIYSPPHRPHLVLLCSAYAINCDPNYAFRNLGVSVQELL